MTTLDPSDIKVLKRELHIPTLDEVKNVFITALKENFAEAEVEVVDCPDLTEEPFTLASQGLGGRLNIVEVGGPPYLLPKVNKTKVYDIQPLLKQFKYGDRAFIAGAGAGPWPYLNCNSELMMNVMIDCAKIKNGTRVASVNKKDQTCVLGTLKGNETRFALLANLFMCEGIPGKVLKVYAKKRIGKKDFISTMQEALAEHYQDKLVGLGGTFLIKEGKARQHVMPNFSDKPLNSVKELDNWLQFYEMSAPLVAVGTFVSAETDLDLRVQHFHSFSHHGEGGHYHIDTTPDDVEYLGYFNLGESLYRVDQPPNTLQFGKD
ncbi:ester hydrolase C11orf54 homolog [Phymastichus coffea]|uniref:ester hydrolase C11orf54 homolog n=1 Tax=Phymastichus coffea TaxID=108790 RepID=UPI00273A83DE|nr:ester hydrolase C11orf54 homolog [Phymastichus coffea]XP_058798061.1 ester hydrolase C11orf54 homolog [Phymastichus coffea]